MELVTSDTESVTIKFNKEAEYNLRSILSAYSAELDGLNLDLQLLAISESLAKAFIADFFQRSGHPQSV